MNSTFLDLLLLLNAVLFDAVLFDDRIAFSRKEPGLNAITELDRSVQEDCACQ